MTGLRLDVRGLQRQLERKMAYVTAASFRPDVERYARRTLQTCIKLTPMRSLALIRKNQAKQYANRVNYIRSVHEIADPTLIVKEGVHWLYAHGRWWAPSYRSVPPEIESIHQELINERERRLQISESEFIAERAQARYLYRRSWWQAGQSAQINLAVDSQIPQSHSRHNPPKDPPRAYAQWRGGKFVLSLVIQNPFLEQESKYKPFTGKQIMAEAASVNRPSFNADVRRRLEGVMA